MGTSGVVFAALPEYRADPQARVHAFCHAVPGAWHQMGVMLSAAGSLAWLRGVVGGEFSELTAEAERWGPGTEGLTFLPYLTGERTPHADPDARGAFTGLEIRHDRGALVRAVLEGVACGLRDSFDLVGGGERGRVSGGGARSELWLKIVASVLEIPLERLAVEEGAAYGAALLGGVAGGLWGDVHEAVAACVRTHSRGRAGRRVDRARTVSCGSATARCTRLCRQPARRTPMTATQDQTAEVERDRPEHRFTFGLWTVGNPGRDPFGGPTREPVDPGRLGAQAGRARRVGRLAARRRPDPVGRLGGRDATGSWRASRRRSRTPGMGVGMATTNLFGHPAFKDGAFTSNDRGVRRAAIGKAMHFIDIAAELGAEVYVFWGGREGTEAGVAKDPRDALERYREAIDVLSATTSSTTATTCASRWSPSPTSRAGTSSCRPSATRCTSSRRSSARRWSA